MAPGLDLLDLGAAPAAAIAVVSDGEDTLTYGELRALVADSKAALACSVKALILIDSPRTVAGMVGYLAALSAGHSVVLVDDGGPRAAAEVITGYSPDLVVTHEDTQLGELVQRLGFRRRPEMPLPTWARIADHAAAAVHPDLGLLARTSGSLGPSKTVRISYANLRANALAIADALGLRDADRTMTGLPLDFSFGLSMVNSALAAGGSIALTRQPPSSRQFWTLLDRAGGTVAGAVTSTYRFLRSTGWDPARHPTLRLLLQAGGPVDGETRNYCRSRVARHGGEFIPMYGQTEATARIAYLPAALARAHDGSVGVAVPGSRLAIEAQGSAPAPDGTIGEIVVSGAGVMLGYALDRADLSLGDLQGGVLHTGDLGYVRDGCLYITGRADRQVKVFGRRVDLDQLERYLLERGVTAAAEALDDEHIAMLVEPEVSRRDLRREVAAKLGLPAPAIRLVTAALPRTASGKVDRRAVRRSLCAGTSLASGGHA